MFVRNMQTNHSRRLKGGKVGATVNTLCFCFNLIGEKTFF